MNKTSLKLAAIALISLQVSAQTIPDAGSLMRQNEQMFRQDQMQRNARRRESFAPEMKMSEATVVTPQRIKFLGGKLLPDDQLQAAAQPFLNRELHAHDLEHLTGAVAESYRRAGWLVRVYIPQQDLSQPDLVVQILENMPSSGR